MSRVLLIVYDNDSFIHWFPLNIGYIASVLRNKEHEVTIYNQDVYHYPETHLTEYLNKNKFDVVGIGVVGGYYQYRKLLKISNAVNSSDNRQDFLYVLGGHGPSPEPKFFLKKTKSDVVCIGEGDRTIVDLLEHTNSLNKVKGIAYRENNEFYINKPRELIKDIDNIPFPAWDLFPMDYYSLLRLPHIKNNERSFPVITTRGCNFKCNFCYRMYKGIRIRSIDNVIEEIKILKKEYNISYIVFADELFMTSIERTRDICESFISNELNIKWSCNGRLNYVQDSLLKTMKKAGCVFINFGIESMDDKVLKNMNKNLTAKCIEDGIKTCIKNKISPGLNMLFGNIGDNENTLNKAVRFLLKYDDQSQLRTIRPVTPYPGSMLYDFAIKNNMLSDVEDFYEKKHINSDLLSINFTDLSDDEFHKLLFKANKKLIENYFDSLKRKTIKEAEKLYFNKNANFRGFRTT